MSGAVYWLQKQRKSELVGLAEHVGLRKYEGLLKPDLEVALEEHMRVNAARLARDPILKPFYTRLAHAASPRKREIHRESESVKQDAVKQEAVKQEDGVETTSVDEARKPRARRHTRAHDEIEQTQPAILYIPQWLLPRFQNPAIASCMIRKNHLTRPHSSDSEPNVPAPSPGTPRTPLSFSQIAIHPIPAVLADRIETQTKTLFESFSSYVSSSPLPALLNTIRATLSSVISIELFALFIEAWGLRTQVLPMAYLTTIPCIPAIGTGEISILIPDLFALLNSAFWGPVALWLLTSLLLPLMAAWFFNFTEGGRNYDPLSYNVTKALLAWVVYVRGGVGGESKEVVEKGVPGGSQGLLIGAGIGVLASLYEAVLRR